MVSLGHLYIQASVLGVLSKFKVPKIPGYRGTRVAGYQGTGVSVYQGTDNLFSRVPGYHQGTDNLHGAISKN